MVSSLLFFIYFNFSNSSSCTQTVRWISENIDMEGKHGNSTQNKVLLDKDDLDISIDWSFLGYNHDPYITLSFKNKSIKNQEIKNINIEFLANDKFIQISEVSGFNVLKDCKTQPCNVSHLSVPTDIIARSNSFISLDYHFKEYINLFPEKGRLKIELNTSLNNNQGTIKQEILLDKYMISYNCIFGKGHALKLIK